MVALAVAACGGAEGEEAGRKTPEPAGEAGANTGGASGAEPGEPICEAGRQVECACPNEGQGVQACAADGSKWLGCQCEGVKPGAPKDPPSIGCDIFEKFTAEEAGCPAALPVVAVCPKEYEESETCRPNRDGNYSCCPKED